MFSIRSFLQKRTIPNPVPFIRWIGGRGISGGYEPDPPKKDPVVINDPILKKIYDMLKSTLTQAEVENLTNIFKMYQKGLVGNFCLQRLCDDNVLLMFEINSESTEENVARFDATDNKISFKNQDCLVLLII